MIELTNNERTKKGIAPLKFDEGLTAAAMVRARESASSFHIPVLTTHHSTQYLMISI